MDTSSNFRPCKETVSIVATVKCPNSTSLIGASVCRFVMPATMTHAAFCRVQKALDTNKTNMQTSKRLDISVTAV